MLLESLAFLAFIGVFYAYFGYPLVLVFLNWIGFSKTRDMAEARGGSGSPFCFTVIITVRNEAKALRRKLENTLALCDDFRSKAQGEVQLIVASDCSDDGTDAIAGDYRARGVELVRLAERGGKERAQRAAIKTAKGDIVFFTDAKIRFAEDALSCLAAYFLDPTVGAVSSVDRVETSGQLTSGEGFYVRYEMWLRRIESKFSTLVGLSGSGFAVRRALCGDLAADIPSDFSLLLEARRRGLRGVLAEDVPGYYAAVASEQEEFSRKVRTVLRGISTLFARREVMNPSRFGSFAWQIISHKLCRWLVPWFALLFASLSFYLATHSALFCLISLCIVSFVFIACLGFFRPSLSQRWYVKVPQFFLVSNTAISVAWLRFLCGDRAVIWDPTDKGGGG